MGGKSAFEFAYAGNVAAWEVKVHLNLAYAGNVAAWEVKVRLNLAYVGNVAEWEVKVHLNLRMRAMQRHEIMNTIGASADSPKKLRSPCPVLWGYLPWMWNPE
jgi:hypothetical protein